MTKCLSASELFDQITGESQWEKNFGDDGSDAPQLNDAELFDLMFNESSSDSEDASDSSDSPRAMAKIHIAPNCSVNECSICFCEFDSCVAGTPYVSPYVSRCR
jgi:hypothetical protein